MNKLVYTILSFSHSVYFIVGYRKYNTAGLILGRFDIGESDVLFDIYTRKLGRVSATAQSIRQVDSKLRHNLQMYSSVALSFVRGRGIWRITYAREKVPVYAKLAENPMKVAALVNVTSLLRRLVSEDLPNPSLYTSLNDGLVFMAAADLSDERIRQVERLIVLRILACLGYLKHRDNLSAFVESTAYSSALLSEFESVESLAVSEINRSLQSIQF